jgi:HEPN domain-containing protein
VKASSENWLKIARYDLKAAEAAFKSSLFIKVYENSHAALEKLLKAVIVENDKDPKKIHDLLRLASEAVIENLKEDVKEVLDELNTVYFSTRYPEDFDELEKELNKEKTKDLLKQVRRIFTWLEEKIN